MPDIHATAQALLNGFVTEVNRYKSVFGALDVTACAAMQGAAEAMERRIAKRIEYIVDAYRPYQGRTNAEQDFLADHPSLRPLVEGLAILSTVDGKFAIGDLVRLADSLEPIPSPQAPKAPQRLPGNPFTSFAP